MAGGKDVKLGEVCTATRPTSRNAVRLHHVKGNAAWKAPGLACVSVGVVGVVLHFASTFDEAFEGTCEEFLSEPRAQWLTLTGCHLQMEAMVLESTAGDFESLENRRHGLSMTLLSPDVRWAAAWVPVRASSAATGTPRLLYRLENSDLVQWANAFEQSDDDQKRVMWKDPAVLRRLTQPMMLQGRLEKSSVMPLQRSFGAPSVLVLRPEDVPQTSWLAALFPWAVVVGFGVLGMRAVKRHLNQLPGSIDVSDVKLELGELQRLDHDDSEGRPPHQS
jgi:hypothetical protein